MATPTRKRSYEERAKSVPNATSRAFLELIVRKRSNLAIAADVRTSIELLKIADQLGPYICLLKTHIDILDDFEPSLPAKLQELAIKHDFMIFEDRKFADIGNTSKQQYEGGVYKIVEWSHITNAQTVPGPGIISGLKEAGLPRGRGLLLLAEMSSAGSLAVGSYTEATVEMAKQHRDFVIGFVGSKQLTEDDTFIVLTPGVSLESSGDALGQQYNTPDSVIRLRGSDVIIVGRGIYQAADPIAAAITYRDVGWKAYEASL